MVRKSAPDEEAVYESKRNIQKTGVDDLVMLPKVSEADIVENLKKRFLIDANYTNIGPVLIAINPYKDCGITGPEYVRLYEGRHRHENPPHIFALAEEAYRTMKNERENQCVIISGESGAGKTVSAKLVMQYVAAVSGGDERVEYVKHVILESNPLLEAFGNAKTLRNDNSSRFGKYFEIQFDSMGDPCGGHITNYLLEKSRVTNPGPGERNFHVFYQFIAGATAEEQRYYQLRSMEQYAYLNQSGCYQVEGVNDATELNDVRKAMNTIGISHQEQSDVWALVASILHMGNIAFVDARGGGSAVADPNALQVVCSYLQVDAATLQQALLFRKMTTGRGGGRGSVYNVPLNMQLASQTRDALSRSLYDRAFTWLVEKVNVALRRYEAPFTSVIGILDIFGFEIFQRNTFEQCCINYVNEKLQQFFIELTLKAEQDEYVAEGIKWEPIKFFNNKIVCDLIEGKQPPGIFSLLDDICATMHAQSDGTDNKFLEKMNGMYGGHEHWAATSGAFIIRHYAGEVTYDIDGFCDKNKDTLFPDLVLAMQASHSAWLRSLFPEDVSSGQNKRPTTAGFKIKTSCNKLMETLKACTPHYIRCIKPNDTKRKLEWDMERCRHQVQYLGLLENVRVRRAGFAYRAPFDRFVRRYKKLSKRTWSFGFEWTGDMREGCTIIMADCQIDQSQWQLGNSKIFVRHPETCFQLEDLCDRFDFDQAVHIQKAWRAYKQIKHALEQRQWAANMLRGKKERQRMSMDRSYTGDYVNYEQNAGLLDCMKQYDSEEVIFADEVVKYNRRNKAEKRDLIITTEAVYLIARAVKKKQVVFQLTRRTEIAKVGSISLSSLQDNFIVIHTPSEYDNALENNKKSEMLCLICENFRAKTGRDLPVNINDTMNYKLKDGGQHQLIVAKNEACQIAQVKGSGKVLRITIASGLPKDTDTSPKGMVAASGGGGGGGGMMGAGPPGGAMGGGAMAAGRGGPGGPGGGNIGGGAMGRGGGPPMGGAGGGGPGMGRGGGGGPGMGPPGGMGRGAPAAAPAPVRPAGPTYRALYAYSPQSHDELGFNENDILSIIQKDANGWWEAELNGARGWVPANYVQEC